MFSSQRPWPLDHEAGQWRNVTSQVLSIWIAKKEPVQQQLSAEQRCRLLRNSCEEYEMARPCEDVKLGAQTGFFFIQLKEQLRQQRTHVNLQFPTLCIWPKAENSVVHSWTPVLWMDQLQSLIFFFSSNSCWWVRFTKFGCLVENRARYLKQYVFRFYAQHVLSFLSIILNWSIGGNFTLHTWKKNMQKQSMGKLRVKRNYGRNYR